MKIINVYKKDSHIREILRGASFALFLKVLGAALAFFFNILLARRYGADGAGIYFLSLTVITIASVISRLGLDNILLRHVAQNNRTKRQGTVLGLYKHGIILVGISSLCMMLIVVFSAPILAENIFFKPELTSAIQIMSISILPFSILILTSESLKGLKRIVYSQIVQSASIPAIALLVLLLIGNLFGILGAIISYIVATIIASLLGYYFWKQCTLNIEYSESGIKSRMLIHAGMPLLLIALMNLIMEGAANIFLGIWGTNTDIGYFSIASRTALATSLMLLAVNSISAPKFAELHNEGELDLLEKAAKHSAVLSIVFSSPFLLLFIIFPEWVMLLFGSEFIPASTALVILSIGQFVNVATGSVGYLLIMTGHERIVRNNVIFTAFLNLGLNLILVPKFLVLGAAISVCASMIIKNLISVYLVKKYLNIMPIPLLGYFFKG